MRNEGRRAAESQTNVLNKYGPHSSRRLGRTCEAPAVAEVHALHAHGEHELVDSACEREGKEREKDETRNEEAHAADPQKCFASTF